MEGVAIIYIAGKISDENREKEIKNMKRFYDKEKELIKEGYDVHNPARYKRRNKSWEHYLARDTIFIVRNKPDMYFLKDWEDSLGARLEMELAIQLNLKIEFEDIDSPIPYKLKEE